jgi:hypothetical protein
MRVHDLTNQIFPQSQGAIKFWFYDLVTLIVDHTSNIRYRRALSALMNQSTVVGKRIKPVPFSATAKLGYTSYSHASIERGSSSNFN